MKKPSIVQLNNHYINEENLKKRFEEEEIQKRNRFMGWILVSMMFLFILPTYNLVKSYVDFEKQNQQVIKLQKEYEVLEKNTKSEKKLAEQLKNDDFVKKYARAKYYLSREGEVIYPVPGLLPK
ncbi:septum formation initiator family protein [Streptococcus dysgalactiae subsp. equisimilis]|uniref:FtsB family cell division protein n=1 Tax=Streptococcus dysgalactiae TaxID=1334 RepID=UPI0010CACB45|nr:septum formation initiator family protein [Streptococcus dysgalactiae]MCL6222129.1 septum formation initiator family protein [Streptococcus dysgalactiae subsp. equisimilis]MDY2963446.1 septum formation initiator family protein [Streptococcus dysgalactiae]MDY4034401.1 septum formation initiator family protein [Streptococcus dysgalactiae]MEC4578578.1 septum formation initiator family protein [Streptococcus dysgalactiae]UMY68180.1 septum formation initiator family protein [Streptococcus dysgal